MRVRKLPHLVALLALAYAVPASAWQTALTGSGRLARVAARAVATGPAGAIFVLETRYADSGACTAMVVKSRADNGVAVWRRIVSDRIGCDVLDLASDLQGDVVVVAPGALVKLSGASGATLWGPATVASATGTSLVMAALAVDAGGDVVVAGEHVTAPDDASQIDRDFVVAKLAGADGAVRWQTAVDGIPAPFDPEDPSKILEAQDGARAVTIDPAGDVVAAGHLGDAGNQKLAVVKLGGANGGEAWRFTTGSSAARARAIVVDAAGAVTVAGESGGSPIAARLTAAGELVWEHGLANAPLGSAVDVQVAPGGDAFIVGLANRGVVRAFAARLAADDGLERWQWSATEVSAYEALALVAGDPVLVGLTIAEPTSARRFSVVRLDASSGGVLWSATPTGSRDNDDMGLAIAATGGDVIAAGALTTGVTATVATVLRLTSAAGAVAWRVDSGGVGGGYDTASALALDASGDPVVVGAFENVDTNEDFAVVKLGRGDGAEAWRHEIEGSSAFHVGARDLATAVAKDHAGGVVTVGYLDDDVHAQALAVVKFDAATGRESWRRLVNGEIDPGFDSAGGVAVDANDDVLVTGTLAIEGVGYTLTVLKLAGSSGVEQWRRVVANAFAAGGSGTVVVDPAGDVVVAGNVFEPDQSVQLLVVKIDGATGVERWRYRAAGTVSPGTVANAASSVAVDAAGDVLVTGVVDNVKTGEDLFVAKIEGAKGVERWRYEYDGSRHEFDRGWSVNVDGAGDVIVSGTAHETTNEVGAIVVKLSGSSGGERWRRAVVGPVGTFVEWKYGVPAGISTVDRAGDVLVTGTTYDPATGFDFTIAKLAGRDGTERWRRSFDGNAPPTGDGISGDPLIMDERGVDVVTDACGNAFAIGRVVNDSAADVAVVGLDGRTGGDLVEPCAPGTVDGCPPVPRPACKKTVRAGSSSLLIQRYPGRSKRNRLHWRWRNGEAVSGADFGSPLGASDYALCMYERSNADPRLVLATAIPGGEPCGNRSCWRPGGGGKRLAYLDDAGRHEGITAVQMAVRAAGRSELVVKAEGRLLALPPLPLVPPLLLQLNVQPGACFEATFEAAGISRAKGTSLLARGGR